jgi:hypothetical protein
MVAHLVLRTAFTIESLFQPSRNCSYGNIHALWYPKGLASHRTRRRCRLGSFTSFRECSHRRLSIKMIDPRGRLLAFRWTVESLAWPPYRTPLNSSSAFEAFVVNGVVISSRNRNWLPISPFGFTASILPVIWWLPASLMNSGGTVILYSLLDSHFRAKGESKAMSRSTLSTDSVPPPQRSGWMTCRAKYRGGHSS